MNLIIGLADDLTKEVQKYNVINIETLQSDHEEVDNRMVIYARYLVENNQIEQVIIAPLDIERCQKYV